MQGGENLGRAEESPGPSTGSWKTAGTGGVLYGQHELRLTHSVSIGKPLLVDSVALSSSPHWAPELHLYVLFTSSASGRRSRLALVKNEVYRVSF